MKHFELLDEINVIKAMVLFFFPVSSVFLPLGHAGAKPHSQMNLDGFWEKGTN